METNPLIIDFVKSYEELKKKKEEINELVSKADLKVSALYHKLEETHFNHVSKSHNFMKELKEALKERREIKNQYYQFSTIHPILNTVDTYIKIFKRQQKKKE